MRWVSSIFDNDNPYTDKPHLQRGRESLREDRGWRTEGALHRRRLRVARSTVREGAETGVDVLKDTYAEEDLSDEPCEWEHVQVLCTSHRAPTLLKCAKRGVEVLEDTYTEEDLSNEPRKGSMCKFFALVIVLLELRLREAFCKRWKQSSNGILRL